MQKIIITFLLLFSSTLLAQGRVSRNQILQDIRYAAQDLDSSARNSRASLQQLTSALSLITQADSILKGAPTNDRIFIECREFAFPLLDRVLPSSDALDQAIANCRGVRDMSVMRFVYNKLSRVMSTRQSVQESAGAADAQMRAKLQLLEFTFSKYNRILPTDRSIEKSLRGLRPLLLTRGGSQSTYTCFQKSFPQFNRTLSTEAAMDRTITACAGV